MDAVDGAQAVRPGGCRTEGEEAKLRIGKTSLLLY